MSDDTKEKDDIVASEATADEVESNASEGVEAAGEEITNEQGIDDLRRSIAEQREQLAAERQRRIEAEQAAYQAKMHALNNDQRVKASNYHEVVSRMGYAAEREKALMQEWTEAKSMGDYQKEAEIQKALIQNSNDIRLLANAKDRLESELRRPVEPVAPPVVDPVEQWKANLGERERAWANRFADRIQTPKDLDRIRAAHYAASSEGIEISSPEYFRFVEQEAGLTTPRRASYAAEPDEDEPPRRRSPPPSAPVSRGGDRKGTVRLSAEQREVARSCGQTDEEYWRQHVRVEKEEARR